jgi:hypothetical protein
MAHYLRIDEALVRGKSHYIRRRRAAEGEARGFARIGSTRCLIAARRPSLYLPQANYSVSESVLVRAPSVPHHSSQTDVSQHRRPPRPCPRHERLRAIQRGMA